MAPTSEERREVAAMLREQADEGYGVNLESMAYALGLDSDDGECGDEDVFNMLADLIDPTCHVVSEALHTGSFGCEEAGTEFTLSCGHTVIVDGDFPPGYCDECGARVVDEDGD